MSLFNKKSQTFVFFWTFHEKKKKWNANLYYCKISNSYKFERWNISLNESFWSCIQNWGETLSKEKKIALKI